MCGTLNSHEDMMSVVEEEEENLCMYFSEKLQFFGRGQKG
jgi:hypothetical protein